MPFGLSPVDPVNAPLSYQIISDPYHKRFSIEKYCYGVWASVVYDSLLLDFRMLHPHAYQAWERFDLSIERENEQQALLKNEEGRVVLREHLFFRAGRCHTCLLYSVHGIFLAYHCLFYEAVGDPFNGVILYDTEGKPVMTKHYALDPMTEAFTTLLEEEWEMASSQR